MSHNFLLFATGLALIFALSINPELCNQEDGDIADFSGYTPRCTMLLSGRKYPTPGKFVMIVIGFFTNSDLH